MNNRILVVGLDPKYLHWLRELAKERDIEIVALPENGKIRGRDIDAITLDDMAKIITAPVLEPKWTMPKYTHNEPWRRNGKRKGRGYR